MNCAIGLIIVIRPVEGSLYLSHSPHLFSVSLLLTLFLSLSLSYVGSFCICCCRNRLSVPRMCSKGWVMDMVMMKRLNNDNGVVCPYCFPASMLSIGGYNICGYICLLRDDDSQNGT